MPNNDLISREAAIAWFFRPYSNEESYSNLDVWRALKAIPAVEAIPVEWLMDLANRGDFVYSAVARWKHEQEAQDG